MFFSFLFKLLIKIKKNQKLKNVIFGGMNITFYIGIKRSGLKG